MLRKTAWNSDVANTLFLLFFAIFIAVESYRLGLGESHNPGPGFFAFGGALILGLTSLSASLRRMRNSSRVNVTDSSSSSGRWHGSVLFVVGAMIVYAAIFEKIGFVTSSFLLVGFLLRVAGRQRWLVTILVALLCSLAAYLLFGVLLGSELPKGVLGL